MRGGPDLLGPDLRLVEPLSKQLRDLDLVVSDAPSYARVWKALVDTTGDASLMVDRDGTEALMVGRAVDSQERERNARLDALCDHLRRQGHRGAVIDLLWSLGRVADNRPNDSRETTAALRRYLRAGGRLILWPNGRLETGGGLPAAPDAWPEALDAGRTVHRLLRRWKTVPQLCRAVRLLGQADELGRIVLRGVHA